MSRAGKDSHGSSGLENILSASSLAETHISPDDLPYSDHDEQDSCMYRLLTPSYVHEHEFVICHTSQTLSVIVILNAT